MSDGATVSIHVVSLPWRHAWRGLPMTSSDARLLRRLDGVRFAVNGRACGGGGTRDVNMSLTLRREVVLVDWESPAAATAGEAHLSDVWAARRADVWSARLAPVRAKGTWRGTARFGDGDHVRDVPDHSYVASLTYGKVKASRMLDFYARGFPATARQATDPESAMDAGIGFAGRRPIRQPCTISFWPADADVARFAYARSSRHADVQEQAIRERWFLESMFVRFVVVAHSGVWGHGDPLA